MNQLINIENLSIEQLRDYEVEIQKRKLELISKQMEMIKADTELKFKETQDSINLISEKSEKQMEVAVNSMRVKQMQYEYINLQSFGANFSVSIGSKTLGKLLRIVGIAMKKPTTAPYRENVPKYAKPSANEKYSTFIWHYENCLQKIDSWLMENGHYEDFYSISSEKELEKFINYLYSKI